MPRSRILVAVVAVALTGVSCYQDPKAALDAMEETLALQSTLEELGSRTTELQFAVDSLRGVVADRKSVV